LALFTTIRPFLSPFRSASYLFEIVYSGISFFFLSFYFPGGKSAVWADLKRKFSLSRGLPVYLPPCPALPHHSSLRFRVKISAVGASHRQPQSILSTNDHRLPPPSLPPPYYPPLDTSSHPQSPLDTRQRGKFYEQAFIL